MRYLIILALFVVLIALACGGDGSGPSAASTAPPDAAATSVLDGESPFPVVLEHETLVVASADGSEITETPLEPGDQPVFGGPAASPDGRYTAIFRDGELLIQEGDGEPASIIEVPSASDFLNFGWSPDSSRILFAASFDGSPSGVYIINVDGSGLTALSEGVSGNAYYLVWTPDGDHVVFGLFPPQGNPAQMYVIRANGTERTLLGEYFAPQGDAGWDPPTLSRDGARIAAVSGGGLRIFDIGGGTVQDLPDTSTIKFSWSPDGRFLAFDRLNVEGTSLSTSILVADVTASAAPRLLTEGRHPRWSPDGGRIAFRRDDQVYTIRPDGTGLAGLGESGNQFFAELAWSEDGQALEFVRAPSDMPHLYSIDLFEGTVIRAPRPLAEPGFLRGVQLAPNAEQIAFQTSSGKDGQPAPGWYTMDIATGELTQITNGYSGDDVYWSPEGVRVVSANRSGVSVAEGDRSPPRHISDVEAYSSVWSPDGTRVAFGSEAGIHVLEVDGADDQVTLGGISADQFVQRIEWSPDGGRVLYQVTYQIPTGTARETLLADLDGSPPVTLLAAEAMASEATWSPDGEAIAYALSDDATDELWLMNPEGGDQRRLTGFESPNYGIGHIHWSPDGAKIAVVVGRNDVYVIDVETGSSLFVATSAMACRTSLLGWSPDGQQLFAVPFCEYQL